jgi:phenylpropionate dioxygenase-like ring-hydroxylating dioxygenase large terminal subunit
MHQISILLTILLCEFSKGWSPLIQRMLQPRLLRNENSLPSAKIIDYPKLDYRELTEQNKYDLQWYVIGETSEFVAQKLKKVTIWNKNYVVWKTENNTYVGLDDVCSHKGASLSGGKLCNNQVVCPYHGYEFDENGTLTKVPGICFRPSSVYDVEKYAVVEKNGWVYLNTFSGENKVDNSTGLPFSETFYTEEEIERNFSVVYLNMNFNCYSRIVSENSLDVMHIGFVHTFGNAKRPAPTEQHPPRLVGPYHYKTSYLYEAGEDSVARKVFGHKNISIENEFILPHTTVARVMFGDFVSTVITFALPITETKSRLFVKTYRNFWDNPLGDVVTENMMYKTMLQDKLVIENIDMRHMDGKFNMRFDKLQNTYKSFYKRFVHNYSDHRKN